ncbi:hypothetical protein NEUTE2DRAFT_34937, partial [Neurospora tetrasperma FGSC 2509]
QTLLFFSGTNTKGVSTPETPALLERNRDVQPSRTRNLFVNRAGGEAKLPSPEEILPPRPGLAAYQGN